MINACTLKFNFSSAHLYHQPQWSRDKNTQEFGKCFTSFGHGHNYTLECDLPFALSSDETLKFKTAAKQIVDVLDHQHLNFVIPAFKEKPKSETTLVPTTENIARYLFDQLITVIPSASLKIRLFEMENLWVEIQK